MMNVNAMLSLHAPSTFHEARAGVRLARYLEEMRKGRRERIEKGSRERIEKRVRDQKII